MLRATAARAASILVHHTPARVVRAWLITASLAACTLAPAVERPPVEDFTRTPQIRDMELSPDGQSVAFLGDFSGRTHLCVMDFAKGKNYRFRIGEADFGDTPMPKEVYEYWWVGNQRLVLVTTIWEYVYGVAAVDRDGRHWRGLMGLEYDPTGKFGSFSYELIHVFPDGDPRVLMLDRKGDVGSERLYPDVLELNTITGGGRPVAKNPGNVTNWLSDDKGVVRIGIAHEKDENRVMYRDSADAGWRTLPLASRGHAELRPLGFDSLNGNFYVAGFNEQGRWSVFPFDLSTGTLGEAIVSDPVYDTLGSGFTPSFNGIALTHAIFSESRQKLIGISYFAETPRVKWLDPEFAKIQVAVDRALPKTANMLVNQSRDDNQLLFLAYSDRDAGTYYLLDRTAHSFKSIGQCRDWIKPSQMSPTFGIHYEARDGQTINGYLTVPVGHEPRGLPLVVMPHGGPWVRDVWGFDPDVQLLASRGYAVLQMNYRGSRGYGSTFEALGHRQIGGAIQDDIEDGTKWAVAAGVADPKRIAICGASYGGYSALFALGKSPGLYQCGISINGVTDWSEMLDRTTHDPILIFARERWTQEIGDPEDNESRLREISPVSFADKITVPALIIQARDDRTVPQSQARKMAAAMKDAGHPAEMLFLKEGGHSLTHSQERLEAYTTVVSFLEKYLGPGVDFRPQP